MEGGWEGGGRVGGGNHRARMASLVFALGTAGTAGKLLTSGTKTSGGGGGGREGGAERWAGPELAGECGPGGGGRQPAHGERASTRREKRHQATQMLRVRRDDLRFEIATHYHQRATTVSRKPTNDNDEGWRCKVQQNTARTSIRSCKGSRQNRR